MSHLRQAGTYSSVYDNTMYKGIEVEVSSRPGGERTMRLDCNEIEAVIPAELPPELRGSEQGIAFELAEGRAQRALFKAHLSGERGKGIVVYDCAKC